MLRLGDEILRLSKLPVLRGQHAKGTAGVRAKFVVEEDRPTETRVGVFATARTFDAVVRFSNGIGRIQPDIKADARGMAIKVLGVDGPQALSEEGDQSSQDFVMINFPVFAFRDARQYASFFVLKRFFMGMLSPREPSGATVLLPPLAFPPVLGGRSKDQGYQQERFDRAVLEYVSIPARDARNQVHG